MGMLYHPTCLSSRASPYVLTPQPPPTTSAQAPFPALKLKAQKQITLS
jgi:hypothetical protein